MTETQLCTNNKKTISQTLLIDCPATLNQFKTIKMITKFAKSMTIRNFGNKNVGKKDIWYNSYRSLFWCI